MTTHYFDIRIIPDPEFKTTILLNSFISKLHRFLYDLKASDVGVSFPEYSLIGLPTLGGKVRFHSSEDRLLKLEEGSWLLGLKGFCYIESIKEVPKFSKFGIVRRCQSFKNNSRLARYLSRNGRPLPGEDSLAEDPRERERKLPFLRLKSTSTSNNYILSILQKEAITPVDVGKFSSHGLAQRNPDGTYPTVPLF